jgi:cytochrome P450
VTTSPTPHAGPTPPRGCPAHTASASGRPESLHGDEFAADPAATYARLREKGPIAPVELAPGVTVSLVTSYRAALDILRAPETYSRDSRRWQALSDGTVPTDNPVVPMLLYRPNALFSDGTEHQRLRGAIADTLDRIDPHALRTYVEQSADLLIDLFGPRGEADLLSEYCARLPLLVFNKLFGCPPELGEKLVRALAAIFDGSDSDKANTLLVETLFELVTLKRTDPGSDMTSWLIAHPAKLDDEELVHQIVILVGAGTQPQQNLICNGLRMLLSDERFADDLASGTLPVDDALDEVLWTDPPLANFCAHFPVHDVKLGGYVIPEGDPVLISLSAANNDPSLLSDGRSGNRAHLAWGAGPHACPAKEPSRVIASVAVEKLLDRIPDIELAIDAADLKWRPGPFHRALSTLPVHFPPIAATPHATVAGTTGGTEASDGNPGGGLGNAGPGPSLPIPEDATSTAREPGPEDETQQPWWKLLSRLWRGR